MNRNVEAHFSRLPSINIQRSIFDRSASHTTSFNVGDLVPVYVDEILPGDTVSGRTSKVMRLQTLLSPLFSNLFADFYWFFVPNRLVWKHWKEFCGENTNSAWVPTAEYKVPKISSPTGGFASGTIADYLGIPPGVQFSSDNDRSPIALPFRGYALICNEFFRDQNLSDPLNIPDGDASQTGSNGSDYINDVANGGMPFRVAKMHDYFTSCLPQPQKGAAASLDIAVSAGFSGLAPVYAKTDSVANVLDNSVGLRYTLLNKNGQENVPGIYPFAFASSDTGYNLESGSAQVPSNTDKYLLPENLFADIPPVSAPSGASVDINQLRLAFAMQRYLELNARSGSRYVEFLKAHFGVTSDDATLQRPQYLGGNRVPIQIHQVTNTAQAEKDFLGDLGAMSVTQDVHFDFEHSFTEHGFLFCLACVRYDHTYSQGLERFWSRSTLFDYYDPVFANLGEQPVYTSELYFDGQNYSEVFGYQEYAANYRYKPSRVSGEMRPGVKNTLASWNLADYYSKAPTLSDGWIREDKSPVDRALAVSSSVANQIFGDFYFDMKFTRAMPMYSIPGISEHM